MGDNGGDDEWFNDGTDNGDEEDDDDGGEEENDSRKWTYEEKMNKVECHVKVMAMLYTLVLIN